MTFDRRLGILCDSHAIPTLLFLSEHGDSLKTEIYRAVGRTAGMPRKLEDLEGAGLVSMNCSGVAVHIGLTDRGRQVVDALHDIETMMSEQ